MNISYQCPHCGKIIPIDPADENRIIKQFLEMKLGMFGDNDYYHGAKWVKLWIKDLEEGK